MARPTRREGPCAERRWLSLALLLCCARSALADEKLGSNFHCPPQRYPRRAAMVPIEGAPERFLPVLASTQPGLGHAFRVAIVVLHGGQREPEEYYTSMMNVVRHNHQEDSTVVVALAFGDTACSAETWLQSSSRRRTGAHSAHWSSSAKQWMFGGTSNGNKTWEGVSSFSAIDSVLPWIQDEYVGIEQILVVGFSSGGQMALRWAIMSEQGRDGKTLGGVPLRVVVGSPSTYQYLDKARPVKDCSPDMDTGRYHSCSHFRVPSDDDRKAADRCDGHWNLYGYGTGGLRTTSGRDGTIRMDVSHYLHSTCKLRSDKHIDHILRERFATKDIHFIFGDKDTKSCHHGRCSDDCESMTQGANRLQRGLNYMSYLESTMPGYTSRWGIFEGGHDHDKAFMSGFFKHWAFDKDREIGTRPEIGMASRQAAEAKADRYQIAARGSSTLMGASIHDYVDREYAIEECKDLCDQDAECRSFHYGQYNCYLLSQCIQSPDSTSKAAAEPTAEFLTFYKPCDAAGTSELFLKKSVAVPGQPRGVGSPALQLAAAAAVASLAAGAAGLTAWRWRQPLPGAGPPAAVSSAAAESEAAEAALLRTCAE